MSSARPGLATTLQTPTAVPIMAILLALAGVAVAVRTTMTSAAWEGQVFPGFVLLHNRVNASVGLAHWSEPGASPAERVVVPAIQASPRPAPAAAHARDTDEVAREQAAAPPAR